MDNLTHTLVGVALGRAGLERRFGKGATVTLALASNLPDVDALGVLPYGILGFAYRRGVTHSVFGVPVLSALLAGLLLRRYRDQTFGRLFGLSLLGAGLHLVFDLFNSYGVMLLHPFTRARWEFGCVFIIDPVMWALLLGVLVLPRLPVRVWRDRELVARTACGLVTAYVLLCAGLRGKAASLLNAHDLADRGPALFEYVFPEPLGCHRWRGVARYGDDWTVSLILPFAGTVTEVETLHTDERSPLVASVRSTRAGAILDTFWKAPVWTVTGRTVEVRDLRFGSAVFRRLRSPFTFRFDVGEDGTVKGPERVVPRRLDPGASPASK